MPTRGIYNYLLIQRSLNTMIHGRRANLTSGEAGDTDVERDLINRAVRTSLTDLDYRGNLREVSLTPALVQDQYDYVLPADVKANRIVDLRPQVTDSRDEFETYTIVPPEEFDRRKQVERGLATVINKDLTRHLRVSAVVDDKGIQVSAMEDTTWGGFSNSVNDSDVKLDQDDYVEGNGCIRFQTDTSDTADSTIGIQKTDIGAFDISTFLARGLAFVDARLTVADTGLHQISLRIGSDSDNYYQMNDSTQNDCTAFVTGWNKIRFDFSGKATAGTPVDTAITYAAIFWSRDTTDTAHLHLEDTDWGFDDLKLRRGKYYYLSYYTRHVWQDTDFTLVENSTHDSHALLLQNDEIEVIMAKAAELASQYLRDYEDAKYYASEYQRLKTEYLMRNPSQASVLTTSRYNFESMEERETDTV